YDAEQFNIPFNQGWQVSEAGESGFAFSYSTVEPFITDRSEQIKRVIEIRYGEQELRAALDEYKASSTRDPFFYHPDHGVIHNSTARPEYTEQVVRQLERSELGAHGTLEVDLRGAPYFVTYLQSEQLGWYVVDYVAVDDILAPINESRNYFYSTIAFL